MVGPGEFTIEEIRDWKNYNTEIDWPAAEKVYQAYLFSEDVMIKQMNKELLDIFRAKVNAIKASNEKPALHVPLASEGDLTFGRYMQLGKMLNECKISIDSLIHSAIIAPPNRGKTVFNFSLATEVNNYNEGLEDKSRIISQVFIDRRKDFRNLPFKKIVLDIKKIPWSFFEPPLDVDLKDWFEAMADATMHAWHTYLASKYKLTDTAYALYQKNGKQIPTMYDVFAQLEQEKMSFGKGSTFREHDLVDVSRDRIKNLIFETGNSTAFRKSFPLWEFLEEGIPIVIEADLSPENFSLLVSWVLIYIYAFMKKHDIRGNLSKGGTLLFFDEAYLLWQPERQFSESRKELGISFVSQSGMFVRDFRMCIIASSQQLLSSDYMSSTNVKMVGYISDYDQARRTAAILGNPRLIDIMPKLGQGDWILKVGDQLPVLLHTEDVKYERISDEDLAKEMKPYIDYIFEVCEEEQPKTPEEEKAFYPRLTDSAKAILQDVLVHPDVGIVTRYRNLKIGGNEQGRARDQLLQMGYCELVEEQIFGSHPSKHLCLTKLGWERLRNDGFDVTDAIHRGSQTPLHSFVQRMLVYYLKRLRFNVVHDHPLAEKDVDVYAEGNNKKTIYEVAISPFIDVNRLASALELVDSCVILCANNGIADQLENQLRTLASHKVEFHLVRDYLPKLRKQVRDYYTRESKRIKENTKNDTNSAEEDDNRNGNEEKEDEP